MLQLFTARSTYKKQARYMAALWTLLIFVGCFMPARDVPEVDVPLADKWVHFILFGGFTFLWLCAFPAAKASRLLLVFACGVALGSLIEIFQGLLVFLGRSCDIMDAVADSIGALLGTGLFRLGNYWAGKQAAGKKA